MFKRIFLGYLAVLLISFAVLTLAFNFTVRQYLINDTVQSLYRVAETLSASAAQPGMQGRGSHMRGAFFNLANRIAYADYVLLSADETILDSSDSETYPPGVKNINEAFSNLAFGDDTVESLVEKDRVAVVFPVMMSNSNEKAALILYSQLDVLTQLNRAILDIFTLALGAGIAVSLIAGALATRVVVGPLRQLKKRATELSQRKFSGKLAITTGDELEELADAFNEMAGQLAEYDRTQKEFFRNTSHELKTPLMSVQGYAEALRDGVIPREEEKESFDIIIRESKRMKSLVDEFTYLSMVETMKEIYKYEPIMLDDAIREAVHATRSLTLEKEIAITTHYETKNNLIKGDPEKIHRLLLNLISNALRHARREITITLNSRVITVEDDGPGFKPEELEKAFDPFYRGENGGSGLGLAISRAIVEKHGGKISAGENPAGGAKIKIVFS